MAWMTTKTRYVWFRIQAEGLVQLSPDTAVSGFPVSLKNGKAEGLQQVRIDSIDGMVAG